MTRSSRSDRQRRDETCRWRDNNLMQIFHALAPKDMAFGVFKELLSTKFNELVPIGTRVRYWPLAKDDRFVETRTRSEAWKIRDHVSVMVEGTSGGVSVEHLQVIVVDDPEDPRQPSPPEAT